MDVNDICRLAGITDPSMIEEIREEGDSNFNHRIRRQGGRQRQRLDSDYDPEPQVEQSFDPFNPMGSVQQVRHGRQRQSPMLNSEVQQPVNREFINANMNPMSHLISVNGEVGGLQGSQQLNAEVKRPTPFVNKRFVLNMNEACVLANMAIGLSPDKQMLFIDGAIPSFDLPR